MTQSVPSPVPLVEDASAWKGADLAGDDSWIVTLADADIDALVSTARGCIARGLAAPAARREDFPLGAFGREVEGWAREINQGRGFVLVRGLPVDRLDDLEIRTIFWGLGLHLGQPISQNAYGDVLGDVRDEGVKMGSGTVRGYRTNERLLFHTDRCEIVGLLCLQPAMKGGLSSIVSSTRIYNEIARSHPEYLEPLFHGYIYASMEEGGGHTTTRVPIYSVAAGVVSCRIQRNTIENTRKMGLFEYSALELEALAYMDALANSAEMRLDMNLARGDMQFINNYTTMHSRTAFEDWPEPGRRRHMVRLWLRTTGYARPVAEELFSMYGGVPKTLERGAAA